MASKQGYNSRLDESLSMRNGKESGKSQSFKSRRDESRGMSNAKSHNDKYMSKGMGEKVMKHEKAPKTIDVPCGNGWAEVKPFKPGNLGYPSQAFDYKY